MSGFYLEEKNRVCTSPKGNAPKKFEKVNLNSWNCNSSPPPPPPPPKKNSAQIKPWMWSILFLANHSGGRRSDYLGNYLRGGGFLAKNIIFGIKINKQLKGLQLICNLVCYYKWYYLYVTSSEKIAHFVHTMISLCNLKQKFWRQFFFVPNWYVSPNLCLT